VSLGKSGIPIKTLIVGDGPQKRDLETFMKESGVENRVIFTGFQDHVEDWYPVMDVFVLPSLTEGTPMALLEAMTHGLPIVATAVGGVPKVIESGKNGMLISSGKTKEIRETIYALYENAALRDLLSRGGKRTVSLEHNITDWIKRIEREYLIATKKP
jgi:glycosyltransferase involved in cell wall biosynthesis